MDFGPDDLVGQFILSRSTTHVPDSWSRRMIGVWHLGFHPALPVLDIQGPDSTVVGWLLGYPIDSQARLLGKETRVSFSPGAGASGEVFEEWLYQYGGRFAAIFLGQSTSRVYLDPCGSLAVVYCAEQELVASTGSLIPYLNKDDDNQELIAAIEVLPEDTYYPFGLTPRRSVDRILPSHYLDLSNWESVRHWPKRELEAVQDVGAAVGELVSLLQNNISAIASEYPLYLALTAGRDSRMLLACTRDHVDRTQLYTVSGPGPAKRLDWDIASRVSRKHGLNHIPLLYESASRDDLERWEYRTGNSVHGPIMEWDNIFRRLDSDRVVLVGAAGELGRGFHFRSGDTENSPISVEDILKKTQFPNLPEIYRRAEHWQNHLTVNNSLTVWGLLYNETFNGCWFGPVHYGFSHTAFYLWPFCHRRIIEIMLSLPREYRLEHLLPIDVMKQEWPELLALPFNWHVGFKKYIYGVQWRWRRLKQKLKLLRH